MIFLSANSLNAFWWSDMQEQQEDLRNFSDHLHFVLKSASVGIWEWNPATDELVWDDGMMKIYGVKRSSFSGKLEDWRKRVHPDDRRRLAETEHEELLETEHTSNEFRILREDGEVRYLYADQFLHRNEQDEVTKVTGLNMDVTDRRNTALARQESENKFHLVAEHVPGMIFRYVLHPDSSHELLYANSRAEHFFGFSAESVMEDVDLFMERIHPDDLPAYQYAIEVSAKSLIEFKEVVRIVRDDRILWAETTSRPQRMANGDIVWDGIMIDITHRKRIEMALKESQSQFEQLTENVPRMICRLLMHPGGTYEASYVSSKCRELFEVAPEAAMKDARQLFRFVHREDQERFHNSLRLSAQSLQPVNEEFRVSLPQQGLRWRQVIGQPTRVESGATVVDAVFLDITHAKQSELQLRSANEELATATKMRDQFLASISHEFRTPLNAILSATEGLQSGLYGSINAKQQTSLDVVDQSSTHLLELINDILDLASRESVQIKLEFSPVDVKSLCESCLRLVKAQSKKKNVHLRLNVPSELPALVADEKRIRQVLINLLTNAVKFTPADGAITLEVEPLPQAESSSADTLRLSVTDTGIGIEPDMVDSVFDPFVQVDSALTRKCDGLGLGLSLVKQFVDLHGGHVSLTSEFGAGSCFSFELPCRQFSAAKSESAQPVAQPNLALRREAKESSDPQASINPQAKTHTILLAEDNDSVAMAATWYLEAKGFRVQRAADGAIAIDVAKRCSPDLILMDIRMPNLDGITAIQQIRQIPKFSQTPIIALTGLALEEDAKRCAAAGANDYLSKPYRMEQLLQVITRFLGSDS
ncbi:MAG: PAS domain-containing protein [Rubripirellula sp.]